MIRGRAALVAAMTVGLVLAAVPGLTGAASEGAATARTRPNIVFVLTDDLSTNLVRYMPQVQQLAADGTSFAKYYVTDSFCCPSRASIFTGAFPHDTGVFQNTGDEGGIIAFDANGNIPNTFAVALQGAGYRTALMGKYLNGYYPTDPGPAGWDEWDVAGWGYQEFNYPMRVNDTTVHYHAHPKDYLTDVLADKATQFLDSVGNSPFLLELSTFAPHSPYVPAPRYENAAEGVTIPATPAYNAAPANPPSWLAGLPRLTTDAKRQLQEIYRKRVQSNLATDDLIARVRAALAANGLADNTYVIFSSDNGYHLGEYRLHAGKQTAFDTDVNVPLVVAGPGVPAGRVDDHLASNVDLAPTFEDITGADVPSVVDGTSLLGLWRGRAPSSWRQGVLIEHHHTDATDGDPDRQTAVEGTPPDYAAVRTADSLYVRYAGGEQEYYDTSADPYELDNLGGDAAPASVKRMLSALRRCHSTTSCAAAAS